MAPPTITPSPIAAMPDMDYLYWCVGAGIVGTLLAGQAWALWNLDWPDGVGFVGKAGASLFFGGVVTLVFGIPVSLGMAALCAFARFIVRVAAAAARRRRGPTWRDRAAPRRRWER